MNLCKYFKEMRNKRCIHIQQLRILRNDAKTDTATRRQLDKKIAYEQRQLDVISDIWNVS